MNLFSPRGRSAVSARTVVLDLRRSDGTRASAGRIGRSMPPIRPRPPISACRSSRSMPSWPTSSRRPRRLWSGTPPTRLAPVIRRMKGGLPPPLKDFRTKILDGNHLARTQRRLKPLRNVAAGPLPGHTLVVLDPALGLVIDVVCCEDGHAQERSLLGEVLAMVREDDLWIADRNFCTTNFLFGIAGGGRAVRDPPARLDADVGRATGPIRRTGRYATGELFEQTLRLDRPRRSGRCWCGGSRSTLDTADPRRRDRDPPPDQPHQPGGVGPEGGGPVPAAAGRSKLSSRR